MWEFPQKQKATYVASNAIEDVKATHAIALEDWNMEEYSIRSEFYFHAKGGGI